MGSCVSKAPSAVNESTAKSVHHGHQRPRQLSPKRKQRRQTSRESKVRLEMANNMDMPFSLANDTESSHTDSSQTTKPEEGNEDLHNDSSDTNSEENSDGNDVGNDTGNGNGNKRGVSPDASSDEQVSEATKDTSPSSTAQDSAQPSRSKDHVTAADTTAIQAGATTASNDDSTNKPSLSMSERIRSTLPPSISIPVTQRSQDIGLSPPPPSHTVTATLRSRMVASAPPDTLDSSNELQRGREADAGIDLPMGGMLTSPRAGLRKKLSYIEEDMDEDEDSEDDETSDGKHQGQNYELSSSIAYSTDGNILPAVPICYENIPKDSTLHQLASKFIEMINFDPWDKQPFSSSSSSSNHNHQHRHSHSRARRHFHKAPYYSETAVYQFIAKYPYLCRIRYHLEEHFASHMLPLSILCCLSTHSRTAKTVEACYWAYPRAIHECDEWVGTPLHYACSYQASPAVLRFLTRADPHMISTPNACGRLPLHMLALFPTQQQEDQTQHSMPTAAATTTTTTNALPSLTAQCVDLLLQQYPKAASRKDTNGYLPLHLACENGADKDVLRHLLSVFPDSVQAKSNHGSTPLHLACLHGAPLSVVDLLLIAAIIAHPTANTGEWTNKRNTDAARTALSLCCTMDSMGQLPLHMAIMGGAAIEVVRRLLQLHPASNTVRTDRGETPWHLACRARASESLLDILRQPSDV